MNCNEFHDAKEMRARSGAGGAGGGGVPDNVPGDTCDLVILLDPWDTGIQGRPGGESPGAGYHNVPLDTAARTPTSSSCDSGGTTSTITTTAIPAPMTISNIST